MDIVVYLKTTRNEKIYKNKIGNPKEIFCIAEVEAASWAEAQLLVTEQRGVTQTIFSCQSLVNTRVCYVDGAWREEDIYTGQGCYCQKVGLT